MIVRDIKDIEGTEDDIVTETWRSKRIILKKDGMGYSVHETTIFAGTETHIYYSLIITTTTIIRIYIWIIIKCSWVCTSCIIYQKGGVFLYPLICILIVYF